MTGALPPELAAGQGAMSEFDPDDYVDKAAHLKQPHGISAAWIVMALVAMLFIGFNRFLRAATAGPWRAGPVGARPVPPNLLFPHHLRPPPFPSPRRARVPLLHQHFLLP